MTRRGASYRKNDIRRAIGAVSSCGQSIAGVEIRPDGSIFIRLGEPLAADKNAADDDLNAVIAEIKANGKDRSSN